MNNTRAMPWAWSRIAPRIGEVGCGSRNLPTLDALAIAEFWQEQTGRDKTVVANPLDPTELSAAMDKLNHAGIAGVIAEAHDGEQEWRSAVGIADASRGCPVTPEMRHRVGSISKTFTAAAVLRRSRAVKSRSTRQSATTCRWQATDVDIGEPHEVEQAHFVVPSSAIVLVLANRIKLSLC